MALTITVSTVVVTATMLVLMKYCWKSKRVQAVEYPDVVQFSGKMVSGRLNSSEPGLNELRRNHSAGNTYTTASSHRMTVLGTARMDLMTGRFSCRTGAAPMR